MNKTVAYEMGEKIDKIINEELNHHPIAYHNWMHWLLFVRTVQTSLDILTHEIEMEISRQAASAGRES